MNAIQLTRRVGLLSVAPARAAVRRQDGRDHGASPGPVNTARVQYQLRQVLVFLDTFAVNKPEVFHRQLRRQVQRQGAN